MELRKDYEFYVGQKLTYFGDDNVSPNAIYDAEVVSKTDRFVTMMITARQKTLNDTPFGKPKPYRRSVMFKEFGRTQHAFV